MAEEPRERRGPQELSAIRAVTRDVLRKLRRLITRR